MVQSIGLHAKTFWNDSIGCRPVNLRYKTRQKHFIDCHLGKIGNCLGLEFTQDSEPVTTPLEPGTKLFKRENTSKEEMKLYPFRDST